MSISHKERPSGLFPSDIVAQVNAAQILSAQLSKDAYTQEYYTNWGRIGGQTVPHWHSQFKSYVKPPFSVPERMECYKKSQINNIEQAFEAVKITLEFAKNRFIQPSRTCVNRACNCCSVNHNYDDDEKNLVVARFKYNYVCLSHYPQLPGEISVVPNNHVAAIEELSPEALRENMIIAMALLPRMQEYAHAYIRDCDGGNVYTKSMGDKISIEDRDKYHLHTRVMPRTSVPFTVGFIDGNSCKLDYDPLHLFEHLKENKNELREIVKDY